MSDRIRTHHDGTRFDIVIDRADKRNAIDWPMMQALSAAIDDAEQASGARVVVIRGEGAGFSAGIDLLAFEGLAQDFGPDWRDNLFPVTAAMQAVFTKIERCSLPVVALLHGFCLGMGLELALACDFRLVAQGTRLGLPETRLGLIPDVGGTTRLTRLAGPGVAKALILTGREFTPDEALRWGIATEVVPADQLAASGQKLVDSLAAAAPLAVSYAKRVINAVADIDQGLQLEAWAQSVLIRTEDFMTGAQAMLMKQPPEWKGK